VHADASTLERYAAELDSFMGKLRTTATRLGLGFAFSSTDGDLERLFRGELRAGGFLC